LDYSSQFVYIKFYFIHHLALNEQIDNFNAMKIFICISTVLTWARTKPLDPVSTINLIVLNFIFLCI